MESTHILLIALAMGLVASLYASVGHGGASGYLAIMALAGFAPKEMKVTALILNLIVASMAAWMFWKAGHFSIRLFLPFAITSVPMAFLGGRFTAPSPIFHILVALALLAGAANLAFRWQANQNQPINDFSWPLALLIGGILGFVSGLIGVGGGIFLTPLMLLLGWCHPKTAAAVSAAFILVNSFSGLAGNMSSISHLPSSLPVLLIAVLAGGWVGATWGSGRAQNLQIRQALALVLVIAAVKMVVTI